MGVGMVNSVRWEFRPTVSPNVAGIRCPIVNSSKSEEQAKKMYVFCTFRACF